MTGRKGGRRGRVHHHRAYPPPRAKPQPNPPPTPLKETKVLLPVQLGERRRGDPPWQKAQPPPAPVPTAQPTKAVAAPKPTNPPRPPPPTPAPRLPRPTPPRLGVQRPRRRTTVPAIRSSGRSPTSPIRPRCPWAEGWCRLGGIAGRHHPLQGGPAPPLPHPRGGRAVWGRGPVGQEKDQTPRPNKPRD